MLRRILAVVLWLIALTVAVHFMFSSFYEDSVDTGLVWDYVNWLMAFGVLVALIVHFLRKRELDAAGLDDSISREYLEANLAFYVSAVLAIWFFWNWSDALVATESQGQTHRFIWTFVNPLFVVVTGATGLHLWQSASRYRY